MPSTVVSEALVATFKMCARLAIARQTIGCLIALCGACSPASQETKGSLPEENWLNDHDPYEVLNSSFCGSPQPGDSPLRRLTNLEYRNTLLDLGFEPKVVEQALTTLPSEPESLGFRNGASALTVTSLLAQKYKAIAELLTIKYTYPCEESDESTCAERMIDQTGARTHRRALSVAEKSAYRAIYDQARQFNSQQVALGWVARAMLQSPHFLYRVEIPDTDQIAPVTGDEMANRLSYMLWKSPPDDQLRTAVAAGELQTREQVAAQAHRMLLDPKAENVVEFFEQWLDLDELHQVLRDPELYPNISPQLSDLMRAEGRSFLLHLLRDPGASFGDMLSANYTFANAELAEHYGLEPVAGDAFIQVEATERHGILTQGMLAVLDGPTRTSIVRRGLKIRTDFLCQLVPAPPDTVDLTLDGISPDLTQAQRLAQHREDASCAECHSRMDPIGEVFEGYDAVGRSRTNDEFGSPVLSDGELTDTLDADGPVHGVAELADRLSRSVEAQQCYMIQNLRYYLGREVASADLCSQAQLSTYWSDRDQSLAELLIGITHTDAFLYKAKKNEGAADLGGGAN